MGDLSRLHRLLGDPDPVGHPIRLLVCTGRLAGLFGGGGGRRRLVGELMGHSSQLLGTLMGLLGCLLAAGRQHLGLIQGGLGLLGGLPGLLQRLPGRRLARSRRAAAWSTVVAGAGCCRDGRLGWGRHNLQAEARRVQVPLEPSLGQGRPLPPSPVAAACRVDASRAKVASLAACPARTSSVSARAPRRVIAARRCAVAVRSCRAAPGWPATAACRAWRRAAGLQQLGHRVRGGVAELVGRPGALTGGAAGQRPGGRWPVAGGPQAAGQLVAGGDELLQRQLVQGGQGGVQVADLADMFAVALEVCPTPVPA